MSTKFNCQKHFNFKLFKQLYVTIQFRENTVLITKIVQFQIIQFIISTQFKYWYSLIVKNISISCYSVLIQLILFSQILFTHCYMSKKFPPLHLGVVAIEKGVFVSPSTKVANFTFNHFSFST